MSETENITTEVLDTIKEFLIMQELAILTSYTFAEKAARRLEPIKYKYGSRAYFTLLSELKALIASNIKPEQAFKKLQAESSFGENNIFNEGE